MNIQEKLSNIQNELVVTKNQRNTFGNYNFRSAEDIMEVAKPICKKHNTVLKLSDEMITRNDRVYVEATATLYDFEGNFIDAKASAREALVQKGMQDAQITGSSSSYARKYALGGLFNLDDNKDPDATNRHKEDDTPEPDEPKATKSTLTTRTAKLFENLCMSEELQTQWFAHFKVKKLVNLKEEDVLYIIEDVTPKLLNKVLAKLENTDNAQYKGVVMKAMCGHAEVDKWSDITFKGNLTYISFANLVKTELDTAKVVK